MIITEEQEYRAHPALNFSSGKHLLKSQKHFLAEKSAKFEPSREMVIGTFVHAQILEGIRPPYAIKPEGMSFVTKEGKAWRDANAGVEILTESESLTINRTIDAIRANKDVMYLLDRCPNREQGIITKYRGVEIKVRLDAHGLDESSLAMICDLKTTSDANPDTWPSHAAKLGYMAQMAFYKTALSMEFGLDSPPSWLWIVAETNDAADVVIYRPSDDAAAMGQKQLDLIIDRYLDLMETGVAKGYPSGIIELDLPRWMTRKHLE